MTMSEHLLAAVVRGDADAVDQLLCRGVSARTKFAHGMTPLHWAAAENDVLVMERLLEHGADPNAVADDGSTPLHAACREDNTDAVALLFRFSACASVQTVHQQRPIDELSSPADEPALVHMLTDRGGGFRPEAGTAQTITPGAARGAPFYGKLHRPPRLGSGTASLQPGCKAAAPVAPTQSGDGVAAAHAVSSGAQGISTTELTPTTQPRDPLEFSLHQPSGQAAALPRAAASSSSNQASVTTASAFVGTDDFEDDAPPDEQAGEAVPAAAMLRMLAAFEAHGLAEPRLQAPELCGSGAPPQRRLDLGQEAEHWELPGHNTLDGHAAFGGQQHVRGARDGVACVGTAPAAAPQQVLPDQSPAAGVSVVLQRDGTLSSEDFARVKALQLAQQAR